MTDQTVIDQGTQPITEPLPSLHIFNAKIPSSNVITLESGVPIGSLYSDKTRLVFNGGHSKTLYERGTVKDSDVFLVLPENLRVVILNIDSLVAEPDFKSNESKQAVVLEHVLKELRNNTQYINTQNEARNKQMNGDTNPLIEKVQALMAKTMNKAKGTIESAEYFLDKCRNASIDLSHLNHYPDVAALLAANKPKLYAA